jgi:hypothetical protein
MHQKSKINTFAYTIWCAITAEERDPITKTKFSISRPRGLADLYIYYLYVNTTRSTRPQTWYGTVVNLAVALPKMHTHI